MTFFLLVTGEHDPNQRGNGVDTREFATTMHGLESKKRADDLETIVDLTILHAALANTCIDDSEKRTE